MQKRRLGRTNLKASITGFGGISIIARSRHDAEKIVRYAYDKGINYFDTAKAYGDSEEKIGAALKRGKRSSYPVNKNNFVTYNYNV